MIGTNGLNGIKTILNWSESSSHLFPIRNVKEELSWLQNKQFASWCIFYSFICISPSKNVCFYWLLLNLNQNSARKPSIFFDAWICFSISCRRYLNESSMYEETHIALHNVIQIQCSFCHWIVKLLRVGIFFYLRVWFLPCFCHRNFTYFLAR